MKFKVIALAALMGISGMAAQANELPDGPHIVTSGTASVDAVPDIATLAIEVNVAAKDAATAKKQADERVAQYISFLELNQIAKKDISSANLRTQPDYDYQDGKSILKGLPRCENGGSHAPSVRQTEFLAGWRAEGGS
ncbi:oxidative stress defense protein [Escherichia coli]|uniref:Oxidative stress defense protein n=1 Tax=Escherichia coli TaxID=562 RepID=A0A376TSV5_ECOLX|nr:oxidative stress defense protein [Escherichia coli]